MAAGGLPHPVLISTFLGLDEVTLGRSMEFKHVFYTWVVMAALFAVGLVLRNRLTLVPGKLQNVLETLVDGLEQMVVSTLGEEGRRFVSLLVGIFIFILSMNLCGLLPGFDAPTANVNTTGAMGLCVFLYYNFQGLKRWGPGYIHHFMGPKLALAPLMLPIEIVSHIARPVSLTLRLFGNIRGEEIVLALFFILAPIVSTFPVYFLFLLAKTLQAFIFFMLAMMYVKGAMDHAH
ncbi:MAG: F0F1 ATP synthase subunit A [Deltaproteobacteria bacterium]|jgi:F-type H+-transporting ATPase subunit a|nr:F0F1 ATP synthase subunit A [Deltaproteobacteria bacterium]